MFNAKNPRQAWCLLNGIKSPRHQARVEAWFDAHEDSRGFRAERRGSEIELNILDVIGYDWWTGEGITTKEIKRALDDAGEVSSIRVLIDSPGGSVFDGIGIFNLLRRHEAKVTVEIVGIAASAASVIAMAGDDILMHLGTELMVHPASGLTYGTADEHEATARALRSINSSIVEIYVNQTKKDEAEIVKLMEAETYMTANEALKLGFATRVITESGTKKTTASGKGKPTARVHQPTANAEGFRPMRQLLR